MLLFDFPMVDYSKSEREEWEMKNGKTRLLSVPAVTTPNVHRINSDPRQIAYPEFCGHQVGGVCKML
jgi:hypothetical protein